MIKLFPNPRPRTKRTGAPEAPAECREPGCRNGGCIRADQAPVDSLVELPDRCLQRATAHNPTLAARLLELGFRPGARIRMGRKVAGGARVVTIGSARYAVDARTLRQLDVLTITA